MKSRWVTLIDGGEVDIACLNCHRRTFRSLHLPKVCGGCLCEMEDCRHETVVILKHEGESNGSK